jgi:hypothetical protein
MLMGFGGRIGASVCVVTKLTVNELFWSSSSGRTWPLLIAKRPVQLQGQPYVAVKARPRNIKHSLFSELNPYLTSTQMLYANSIST